jgi:hypothetical protein
MKEPRREGNIKGAVAYNEDDVYSWHRVLTDKVTVTQYVNNYPVVCGIWNGITCSQERTTGPSPNPYRLAVHTQYCRL